MTATTLTAVSEVRRGADSMMIQFHDSYAPPRTRMNHPDESRGRSVNGRGRPAQAAPKLPDTPRVTPPGRVIYG
jgi:hypothetical protein